MKINFSSDFSNKGSTEIDLQSLVGFIVHIATHTRRNAYPRIADHLQTLSHHPNHHAHGRSKKKKKKKNRKKRETPQHLFSHQLSRFTCALAQRSNFFTELPHRTKKRAISHPSIRVVDTHCSYSSCPCDVAAFRKLSSDR